MGSRLTESSITELLHASSAKYSGERGKQFQQLIQQLERFLQRRRNAENAKGKDVPASADVAEFLNRFTPGHASKGIAKQAGEALERSLQLAKLGWIPPPVPLQFFRGGLHHAVPWDPMQ